MKFLRVIKILIMTPVDHGNLYLQMLKVVMVPNRNFMS